MLSHAVRKTYSTYKRSPSLLHPTHLLSLSSVLSIQNTVNHRLHVCCYLIARQTLLQAGVVDTRSSIVGIQCQQI